jgi:hypothetical protein
MAESECLSEYCDEGYIECWTCRYLIPAKGLVGRTGLDRVALLSHRYDYNHDKGYFISEQEIDQLAKDLQCKELKEAMYKYIEDDKEEYFSATGYYDDYEGCDVTNPVDVSDILGPNIICNSFFDMFDQVSAFIVKNRHTPERIRLAIHKLFDSHLMGFYEIFHAYKCDTCYENR